MQKNIFKKSLVIGIIILFLGASVVSALNVNPVNEFKTINRGWLYVGGSGPGNYTKIQDAIDNATSGYTVYVYSGTYYENVIINKTINLIGEDKNTTVIDGGGSSDVVFISANWVNVSGFTMQNGGNFWDGVDGDAGIDIKSNQSTISFNNIISNDCFGVLVYNHNNNNISNNNINNNQWECILLKYSTNNIIYNNKMSNQWRGILFQYSTYNTIIGNTISMMDDEGILVEYSPSDSYGNVFYHNNLVENSINAWDYGDNYWDNGYPSGGNYWDDYDGTDADGDGIGDTPYNISGGNNQDLYPFMYPNGWIPPSYVWVDDDFNTSTPGWGYDHFNKIQYGVDAVDVGGTVFVYNGTYHEHLILDKSINLIGEDRNNTIIDAEGNGDVVYVDIDWVNISEFTIQNSGTSSWPVYDCGIETISNHCSITNNILIENKNGIYLNNADNNLIINNDISSNPLVTIGIMLEYSNSNIIDDNYIHYNYHGIELQHSNLNVISTNNLIDNNNSGVWLRYSSYNNFVYHNNFINNTWGDNNNAVDECSNVWYNATLQEGNYYDDYTGVDNNGDGIGDTPYNIPGGDNQDLYPFMEQNGWLNEPPNNPSKPSGQTHGKAGVLYTYTTNTTDPDGDQVYYKWDWGDGSFSDWLGPNNSGIEVSASHSWSNGSFEIKVKAKDIYGAESDWSEPLTVTITKSKNKAINTPFIKFLQNFIKNPNLFLIFQKIIQGLRLY